MFQLSFTTLGLVALTLMALALALALALTLTLTLTLPLPLETLETFDLMILGMRDPLL
jgi:hypothetical protein